MLNEKLEYKEYTYDLANYEDGPRRIKYSGLRKGGERNIGGLERILTIIARRFLFYDNNEAAGKEDRDAAKLALFSWLGYKPTHPDRYSKPDAQRKKEIDSIFRWLPQYLEKMKEGYEAKSSGGTNAVRNLEKWISLIREKGYIGKISGSSKTDKGRHVKIIKIEKVIANSLHRKKLKIFYLACKDPHFDEKNSKMENDTLLRIVAAYMLENYYFDMPSGGKYCYYNEQRQETRFAPFSNVDLSNWYQNLGGIRTESGKGLGAYSYNGEPTIERVGESGDLKIKFNDEWFRKCEWVLIDATDNDDALDDYLKQNPEHHFYRDDGSCKPLAENQRYDRNN